MKSNKLESITGLLKRFLDEDRPSILLASELEVALDDAFPEDEDIQTLVTALAAYKPGGGEYLYDKESILSLCRSTLERLVNEGNNSIK